MAETVIAASLKLDSQEAVQSVKSFKQELREATNELIKIQAKFGETSKEAIAAAKGVAQLKAQIKDAKEVADLFNPETKFQAFGNAVRASVGGVTALTGAMALFGGESKATQEALLKVQGALALTEGVNTLADAAKDFTRLKTVAVEAFQTIKAEIGATGIGLFVLAIGAIVAYWGDIKNAVGLASAEQEKALEVAKKDVEIEQRKLDLITSQNNVLKEQGKSQQQILDIQNKQIEATIKASIKQLEAQKVVSDQAVGAALANSSAIKAILGSSGGIVDKIFSVKSAKEEGDKTNAEITLQIAKLKDQLAGNNLAITKENASFNAQIRQYNKDAGEAGITDAYKLSQLKLHDAYQAQVEQTKVDVTNVQQRNQIIAGLTAKYNGEALALAKENKKKTADELRKIQFETDSAGITDQNLLAQLQLKYQFDNDVRQANYEIANKKQREEKVLAITLEYEAKSKAAREKGLIDFEAQIKKGVDAKRQANADIQEADEQLAQDTIDKEAEIISTQRKAALDLADEIGNLNLDAAGQQAAAQMKQLDDWYKQRYALIKHGGTAEVALTRQYEKQKSQIAEIENQARLKAVSQVLGNAAALFEKNTIAYKAFAIAQTVIDTYQSATASYKSLAGIPVVGPALGFAAAAVAIVAGLENVAKITSVDTSGTTTSAPGGGASPSAPLTPQPTVGNTQLPQAQLNQINNAANPVRAFVVESDVTTNQQRVRRLNRAAKLGA